MTPDELPVITLPQFFTGQFPTFALTILVKTMSLPLIRSGRNGGVGRRGPAAEECCRRSGWLGVGAHLWPATGVFGCRCGTAGRSAAHDADDARRRSHDQGTRV